MAWTENDRQKIRFYLGASAVYRNWYALLNGAITAVQSTADGGNQPDNSVETAMRAILADLDSLAAKLRALWDPAMVQEAVGDVKLDAMRGRALLLAEGRRLACQLGTYLDFSPVRDVFSAAPIGPHGPGTDPLRV